MENMLKMLPVMIRLSGDNEAVREQAVFVAWRVAAGEKVAYNCIPVRLDQKHLVIAVMDAAWKKQMENLSGDYLFRINSMLKAPLVTFIEFRIDRSHVQRLQPTEEKEYEFHHLAELEEELKPAAEHIKDPALRELFLRAAAKSLERRGA